MTHLKPRSATVLLYQGDDMDQLAYLKRALDVAERQASNDLARGGGEDEDAEVAEKRATYEAFLSKAADRALEVVLNSIGKEFFRDLLAAHPPRMVPSDEPAEDGAPPKMVEHEDDGHPWGVNTDTFPKALLTFYREETDPDGDPFVTATIAKPDLPTEAKRLWFVERELADGDFHALWTTAFALNRFPSADPNRPDSTSALPSMVETSR